MVASTYNLRTTIGAGMPTQIRRGEAWTNVSSLIMSMAIGHYERWPQCPDLLRKSWNYISEIPYLTANTFVSSATSSSASASSLTVTVMDSIADALTRKRKHNFFFSGNFALYGSEMVCSVRNALLDLSHRHDMLVVNTTKQDYLRAGVSDKLFKGMQQSVFCIVAVGSSYSTSSMYNAIAAGCIPVVISDWYTFAFPWLIPYQEFVIRLSETEFLRNPSAALTHIVDTVLVKGGESQSNSLLENMRKSMKKYWPLLSFQPVAQDSDTYQQLLGDYLALQKSNYSGNTELKEADSSDKKFVYLPFDAMLLEFRHGLRVKEVENRIPCERPYKCIHYNYKYNDTTFPYLRSTNSLSSSIQAKIIPEAEVQQQHKSLRRNNDANLSDLSGGKYAVLDGLYQVNFLYLPPSIPDIRSHLCKHTGRLIGTYKMVFFMQCVRVLWPLQPGLFKPPDNVFRHSSLHPLLADSANAKELKKYTVKDRQHASDHGISLEDALFVLQFHNVSTSRTPIWDLTNYPLNTTTSKVVNLADYTP